MVKEEKVYDTKMHCNDAKVEFACDECDRKFTTKSGRSRHKSTTHRKETVKKEDIMKRTRSVPEKTNSSNFKCKDCTYTSRSKWALKAHLNHKHKEPTSPNDKKPRFVNDVVKNILTEVVQNMDLEEKNESKNKTTIEPSQEFLLNTANSLAEMLDNVANHIDEEEMEEADDMEELENRLDILRGDKPRNKKADVEEPANTLVTLPLKDVEDLRCKLRNLEEINEELRHRVNGADELKEKFKILDEANKELEQKLKASEAKQKKKEPKKNKEQASERFITIDMEIGDDNDDIEQLVTNKEKGFSRSDPMSEAQKRTESEVFDCQSCERKFNERTQMVNHQKVHAIKCTSCDKTFTSERQLQEHACNDHDEMICHMQCEGGRCTAPESQHVENMFKCNFCEKVFSSRNTLLTHKSDTHKTFKPCRDPVNCVYQSGCYFSHVPVTTGKIRCFQCGEEFENKNTLMIHRKIHGRVRLCTKLTDSQCDRGESCWWSHNMNDQVFQQVTENLRPPIIIQQENLQPRMDLLNTPNLIMVNMLKTLNIELMKIKEVLNIK